MAVTVYRSTDASAPSLTGAAGGALISVLDACLVNGYGAKTAAGWAKEFSNTNVGVYRAPTGLRHRLRVDDTAGQEARLTAYVAMSNVDAGTDRFPQSSQVSGGLYVRKSNTADGVVRPWLVVASNKFFYFFVDSGVTDLAAITASGSSGHFAFGEFTSYKSGDLYNSILIGAVAPGTGQCNFGVNGRSSNFAASPGHYVARNVYQFGSAIQVTKTPILDVTTTTSYFGDSANYPPFPDPVIGGMVASPIAVVEAGHGTSNMIRGILPGIWAPLMNRAANHLDVIDGQGDLAGKSFLSIHTAYSSQPSRVLLEISDTW